MALEGKNAKAIYEALSHRDVQNAADEFRPVYERTDGNDGYVSLEVNPHLAYDTHGTIQEARRLWDALNRPNVFIKVPATAEGLPAIQQLISEGINVNVTLLFGLPRYRQVAEAYITGIEARTTQGKAVKHVASVASFFVSRIDSLVDPLLEPILAQGGKESDLAKEVRGQVAIASAKMAYQIYKEIFGSDRFKKLAVALPASILGGQVLTARDTEPLEGFSAVEELARLGHESVILFVGSPEIETLRRYQTVQQQARVQRAVRHPRSPLIHFVFYS
jgi:transaldolase/glucose-6-phosphate isomerase